LSAAVPGAETHLLKRTAVHPMLVFQVKGESRGLSRRDNLRVERDRLSRIHTHDRQSSEAAPMLIVETRGQASRKKHPKNRKA
jgi:hypothetical protein